MNLPTLRNDESQANRQKLRDQREQQQAITTWAQTSRRHAIQSNWYKKLAVQKHNWDMSF